MVRNRLLYLVGLWYLEKVQIHVMGGKKCRSHLHGGSSSVEKLG